MATKTSRIKTGANAITVAAAVIGGIFAINIVANRFFGRVDLTEDGLYKLSDSSHEVVKNLPDKLIVRAYISGSLPPPINAYGRYVRDLLDEYKNASDGKFVWEAIDPLEGTKEERDAKKEEMKKYKIQPITLEVSKEAKVEISGDNYLGIAFVYGSEDIQAIPQITQTEGIEYSITSIIKKLTQNKKKKIGLLSSEGELSAQQGLQLVHRVVQDFELKPLDLTKETPGDDLDALLVIGPRKAFNDKAKHDIDAFLMKGKSVAFFVDGMVIETPNQMQMQLPGMDQPKIGRANDVNLNDQLEKYGVKVGADMILDDQNTIGLVQVGQQDFPANHPVFVAIKQSGLASDSPITGHMKALIDPFASSVELVGALKEGKEPDVKALALFSSSAHSWKQSGFFLFNPQAEPQRTTEAGPFPLAFTIEGKIKSAYGEASAPAGTRLLVVGDSDMLNDQHLRAMQVVPAYRSNLLFFLNTLDWLTHDEVLIALRAKGMAQRPLTVTYDGTVKTWVALNVVGIPALLIVFGLILWRVRTARRRGIQL